MNEPAVSARLDFLVESGSRAHAQRGCERSEAQPQAGPPQTPRLPLLSGGARGGALRRWLRCAGTTPPALPPLPPPAAAARLTSAHTALCASAQRPGLHRLALGTASIKGGLGGRRSKRLRRVTASHHRTLVRRQPTRSDALRPPTALPLPPPAAAARLTSAHTAQFALAHRPYSPCHRPHASLAARRSVGRSVRRSVRPAQQRAALAPFADGAGPAGRRTTRRRPGRRTDPLAAGHPRPAVAAASAAAAAEAAT